MPDLLTEANQLLSKMDSTLESLLNTQCAEKTKDEIVSSVEGNVYALWIPKVYERRGNDGGMSDRNAVETTVNGNDFKYQFKAKQTVPSNPRFTEQPLSDITDITEQGRYGSKYRPHPGARPYMAKAEYQYWGNGSADKDIENALNDVKL